MTNKKMRVRISHALRSLGCGLSFVDSLRVAKAILATYGNVPGDVADAWAHTYDLPADLRPARIMVSSTDTTWAYDITWNGTILGSGWDYWG